jgi:CheY-like chemotaxis protein
MPLVNPAIATTANTSASTERTMRLRNRVAIGLDSRVQHGKGERMSSLLLVEDDAAIAGPLMRALDKAGHVTTWVSTGGDAELVVLDSAPELVVLDLGLPDIDGIEVCRRLRSIDDACRSSSSPRGAKSSTSSRDSRRVPTTTSPNRSASANCSRAYGPIARRHRDAARVRRHRRRRRRSACLARRPRTGPVDEGVRSARRARPRCRNRGQA